MGIRIVSYGPEHEAGVAEFNQRLREAQVPFQFYGVHSTDWLQADPSAPVHRIYRLAVDDEGKVRGGYALRCQDFLIRGEVHRVANYQLPLSEGIYDPQYRTLGTRLLRSALRENPLMYSLGMGGIVQPLPRLLSASGFKLCLVPFFFRVIRARRFLLGMGVIRQSRAKRMVAAIGAYSGLGAAGFHLLQTVAGNLKMDPQYTGEPMASFQEWGDQVWEQSRPENSVLAVRSAAVMDRVFPPSQENNIKLRVLREGRPVGYVVVRCTEMKDDRYFGSLRLGSIVDGWAEAEHVRPMIGLATDFLARKGADLVISNQSHGTWVKALRKSGFLSFRSNFGLAVSPKLSKLIGDDDSLAIEACHFNRSDGDGPIHL